MHPGLHVALVLLLAVAPLGGLVWLSIGERRNLAQRRVLRLRLPRVDLFIGGEVAFNLAMVFALIWTLEAGVEHKPGSWSRNLADSGVLSLLLTAVWSGGTFLGIPLLATRVLPKNWIKIIPGGLSWRIHGKEGYIELTEPFELSREVARLQNHATGLSIPHLVVRVRQGDFSVAYFYEWSQPEWVADPVPEGDLSGVDAGGYGRVITDRLRAFAPNEAPPT